MYVRNCCFFPLAIPTTITRGMERQDLARTTTTVLTFFRTSHRVTRFHWRQVSVSHCFRHRAVSDIMQVVRTARGFVRGSVGTVAPFCIWRPGHVAVIGYCCCFHAGFQGCSGFMLLTTLMRKACVARFYVGIGEVQWSDIMLVIRTARGFSRGSVATEARFCICRPGQVAVLGFGCFFHAGFQGFGARRECMLLTTLMRKAG